MHSTQVFHCYGSVGYCRRAYCLYLFYYYKPKFTIHCLCWFSFANFVVIFCFVLVVFMVYVCFFFRFIIFRTMGFRAYHSSKYLYLYYGNTRKCWLLCIVCSGDVYHGNCGQRVGIGYSYWRCKSQGYRSQKKLKLWVKSCSQVITDD